MPAMPRHLAPDCTRGPTLGLHENRPLQRPGDAICRGITLETEVLGLQPFNLAVAFDDDRRALVLVANHRSSHSSPEGLIDHPPVLAEDSIDVFLRFSLHSVLWR